MSDDEAATIQTLTAYREVMTSLIQQHRGRVVDSPGDNLLAEFASAVDAIQGAVAIQHELKTRNAELPEHRQMAYRIGLNVGDVVVEGERLYGDGVNIAARLESLAEGGGICISEAVHMQIKNKLPFGYEYQGEQNVKNIAEPVRAYKVQLEEALQPGAGQARLPVSQKKSAFRWKTVLLSIAALVFLIVGIGGVLLVRSLPFPLFRTAQSPVVSQQQTLHQPSQASIAVLPFDNGSHDPSQEYFSDGLTETFITALSKQSALFVTDRRSAFTYKGKEVEPQQVSQELGVQYVLEGSVQKVAERVHMRIQLIDTTTGEPVWSDRYDQELSQLFALHKEIQEKIISGLKITLSQQERDRLQVPPTDQQDQLGAYDAFLQGLAHHRRSMPEDNAEARQLFGRAIELDPNYAAAHAMLSETYLREWSLRWGTFSPGTLEHAFELAQKAVGLDESLAVAHDILSQIYTFKGQPEQASAEVQQAIALRANNAHLYVSLAQALNRAGKPQDALAELEKARRLDPHHIPHAVDYLFHLGFAYRLIQQYDVAIATHRQVLLRDPEYFTAYIELAIIYHELGQTEDAQAAEDAVRQLNLNFPLEELRQQRTALTDQQEEGQRLSHPSLLKNVRVSAHLMSGFAHFIRSTPEANGVARQEFATAAALDPQFAMPHAAQALAYLTDWSNQWSTDPQTLEHAFELAHKAVALDDSLAFAHMVLCLLYPSKQQYERAIVEGQRAVELNPNYADGIAALALSLSVAGQPNEALAWIFT